MERNLFERAKSTLSAELKALRSLEVVIPRLLDAALLIKKRKGEIIVTGVGKSGFIAQKIAATLTSMGERAYYLHPVDAIHGDLGILSRGDVLLALSFSGESKEVMRIVSYARKQFGTRVVSFTKNRQTSLGKISDIAVEVNIKEEGSPHNLAPMASTTAMLVLGDILASILGEKFKREKFAINHPGGALGLELVKIKRTMKTGKELPLVRTESNLNEILKEITKKSLGIAGVQDSKGTLVGIITDGDIRRGFLKGIDPQICRAKDLMSRTPKTISSDKSLKDALVLMETYKVTTLFILEKKIPAGILHIHDIIEANLI